MDLSAFCAKMAVEEAAAAAVLAERSDRRPAGARHADLWAGILASTAVVLAVLLAAAFARYGLGLQRPGNESVLLGVAVLAWGLNGMTRPPGGGFRSAAAPAACLAGLGLACAGLGFELGSAAVPALFAAAVAAFIALRRDHRAAQFLASALAAALAVAALAGTGVPHLLDVLSLAAPIGVGLLLLPPRVDLDPTALVLLLIVPVLSLLPASATAGAGEGAGLAARTLDALLILVLLVDHWRRARGIAPPSVPLCLAAAGMAIAVLLPAGAAGAFLVVVVGFVLGSLPLAAVGAVLLACSLARFYAALETTSLATSAILIGVGALLLAASALAARSATRDRRA